MRLRLPVLTLIPLCALLIACWWLLSRELVLLLPFRGDLYLALRLALFAAPFYAAARLYNAF